MISYLPDLAILAIAVLFVLMWRRTVEHRDVQVWVGEEMGPRIARRLELAEKRPSEGGPPRPQSSSPGGPPISQPRHFRVLRWIGVECRLENAP